MMTPPTTLITLVLTASLCLPPRFSLTEVQLREAIDRKEFRSTAGWPRLFAPFKPPNAPEEEEPPDAIPWDKDTAANFKTCWNCTDCGDPEVLCCDGICRRSFHLECIGLDEMPEGAWFCPQCAEAEFPEPHCNDNDPVGRSVLLCAIEDHKLRDDDDDPAAPKHAYLTHLLNTPRLQHKLQVNLRDKERGFNALHYAVCIDLQCPAAEILRLVELGCNVNLHATLDDIDGNATPVHMAIRHPNPQTLLPLLTSPVVDLKAKKKGGSGVFAQDEANSAPILYAFALVFALREHLLVPKRSPTDADPTAEMDDAQSEESLGYSFPSFIRSRLDLLALKPLQFTYLMLRFPRVAKSFRTDSFKALVQGIFSAANEPNPFDGVTHKTMQRRLADEIVKLIQNQHRKRHKKFAPLSTLDRVLRGVLSYARWARTWEHVCGRAELSAHDDADEEADQSVKEEPDDEEEEEQKEHANGSSSAAAAAPAAASVWDEEQEEEGDEDVEEEECKQTDSPPLQHRNLPPASDRSARSPGPIDEPSAVGSQLDRADDDAEDDAGFQPEFEDAQMLSPEPVQSSPPAVAPAASPSPAPAAPAAAQSRKRRADESISASPVAPAVVASAPERSLSAASSSSKRSKVAASVTAPPILPPIGAAAPMRLNSADNCAEEKSQPAPPIANASSPAAAAAVLPALSAAPSFISNLLAQAQEYRQLLARGVHCAADAAAIQAALARDERDASLADLIRVQQQHLTASQQQLEARQQLQQLISNNAQREPAAANAAGWADSSSQSMSVDSQPPRQ